MEATEKLLSIPQVMQLTGLSKTTLYRLVAKGQLRPVRVSEGGKYLFPQSEMQRWLADRLAERPPIEQPQGASCS